MRNERSKKIYLRDRETPTGIVQKVIILVLLGALAGTATASIADTQTSNGTIATFSQQQNNQMREVSGRVVDENGEPLAGVNVVFRRNGSEKPEVMIITNHDGKYKLAIPENVKGNISFSFMGTKTVKEEVGRRSTINATLLPDINQVEEVVITGLFTRKAESYTGAVTTVKAEELERFGNRDVLSTLRNIDPAFNVIESNSFGSDPNRLPDIQIRGNTSLPNVGDLQDEAAASLNTPLVILDGFESSMRVLQNMNENDIASITILKDASATAIYGSRGANGVVVVTTKQPEKGNMRVTWRSDLMIEAPDLTSYDMLNAREKLELERTVGLYDHGNPNNDFRLKQYYNTILAQVNSGVDTYWLSKPLQTGVGQKHNIRIEGGDRKFSYAGTVQYNNIEGVMKGSGKQVFNGSLKLVIRQKNWLFQNNLIVGVTNEENSPYGSFSQYVTMNPYWTGYDANGNIARQVGDFGDSNHYYMWTKLPANPLYNATLNTFDKNEETKITNNLSIEWNILEALKFRANLGLSKTSKDADNYKPASHTDFTNYSEADFFRKGSYQYSSGKGFNYDGSLNLSYNKVLNEKHVLFAGANYNIRQNTRSYYTFKAEGFTSENIDYLGAALQYAEGGSPSGLERVSRSIGLTFNTSYMYDNKYFADFSLRTDGSSQFGSDKRFAPFWSTGAGWNLHEEGFIKGSFVNQLRLRVSTGTRGSQNFSPYQALSTYKYYTDDRYYSLTGAYLMALGNEDLEWQQTFSYNLGLESQFWKGRLSASFDFYNKRTDGMISSVNLAPSNGFDSYVANIGEISNKGLEFRLTAFILRDYSKGISWNIGISGIHNVNKIAELSQALKDAQEDLENKEAANPNKLYKEGHSMSTIWVVRSLGIDPSTGKEAYLTKDGEKTFIWSSKDLIDGGNTEPKLQGNINTSFRRKNLSLTMSFGYRLGGQIYNSTLINRVENANYRYNVDSRVYDDRWKQPGDHAAFKSLFDTKTTYKSTRFVQDENTLTMQNINVRYNLKSMKFVKNLGIESFELTGNAGNLFYISTVKRERGTSYPFSRNFALGVNVIF
ncbi:MAG: SusC/RagA family TonB-linked outer membrane protein [Bacteroidales bacterium]